MKNDRNNKSGNKDLNREVKPIDHKQTPVNFNDSQNEKIELNFPRPVPLSIIIEHVAAWSEVSFVMEPGLNKSIQIFAPRPLSKPEAFNLFIASLETVGLRAVMLEGNVAKIVAHGLGKVSV
ncbi:MAG: hypothetical protein R3B45_09315 [Bdellovibrionota bacterium]